MVGYDADKNYGDVRQFMHTLCERNLMEQTRRSQRQVEVVFNLKEHDREVTQSLSALDYDDDKLEELKSLADGDLVTVNDEEKVLTSYKVSMNSATGDFTEKVCKALPDYIEVEGETFRYDDDHYRRTRWATEDGRCSLTIKRSTAKERRILSKEGKRESDDMFETMAKVPSFSFKIVMVADDGDVIDALSEEVIPELHKRMAKESSIGKVRYTSCERQQRTKGECYDI